MTPDSEAFTIIWPDNPRFVQLYAPRCPSCNRPVRGPVKFVNGHLYHALHAPEKWAKPIPSLEDERDTQENAQREEKAQEAEYDRYVSRREC